MPLTRVISTSLSADMRHPILRAISDSFIPLDHKPSARLQPLNVSLRAARHAGGPHGNQNKRPRKTKRLKVLSQRNVMVVFSTRIRQGEAALMAQPPETPPPELPMDMPKEVLGPAWSVGAATMISRILGVVREVVLAKYFGAGLYTDAFNVAYRIPNLLRDLFAEGALSSAFIPTFVRRLTQSGKGRAWLLANRLLSALSVILAAVTLVFFFGAKAFVYLLAAGYAAIPEKLALTTQMTRIMSPFLLCIALASVGMGILNACGSFFIPAMASSAFNICCILAGIFLSPLMPRWGLPPILSMAIGVLLGGASQFLVMIPNARGFGFRFRFDLNFSDPDLRHIARLMLPAIVGLSATQINITVDSQIASLYGNGPVSWLNYGFRLMQFPIGVFGIAIATATMTSVARYAAQNDREKLHATVRSGIRLAACLTFPSTIGLILFREEIVRTLYERGFFLPSDTLMTSKVVLLYALGLFSYSAVKILVPVFYALNDTWTPVRMSMITVAAKVALNFLLAIPFGFLGLALATTAASWMNCGLLVSRLVGRDGEGFRMRELGVYVRIAAASLAMGLLSLIVFHAGGMIWLQPGFWGTVFRLSAAVLFGLASFVPLLRLFKVEEANGIIRMLGMLLGRMR
jgi:putative peptidoglycan lipid II flippase